MKISKLAVPVFAALLLAGAARSARAHDDDGAPPEHRHMSAAKLKDKLGLTDEQVKKLDGAVKSVQEAVKPLRESLKKDMIKLKEQVKAEAKDDEIQSTLDALQKDREAVRSAMEKHMAEVKGILSPTQRAKMMLHMAKRRRHFWQRWGHKKDKDDDEKDEKDEKKG